MKKKQLSFPKMKNAMAISENEKCNKHASDGWPNDFSLLWGGWIVCLESFIAPMLSPVPVLEKKQLVIQYRLSLRLSQDTLRKDSIKENVYKRLTILTHVSNKHFILDNFEFIVTQDLWGICTRSCCLAKKSARD